jgi:hypothetical protein
VSRECMCSNADWQKQFPSAGTRFSIKTEFYKKPATSKSKKRKRKSDSKKQKLNSDISLPKMITQGFISFFNSFNVILSSLPLKSDSIAEWRLNCFVVSSVVLFCFFLYLFFFFCLGVTFKAFDLWLI